MRSIKQEEEDSIEYRAYKKLLDIFKSELKNVKWYEFRYRRFIVEQIEYYDNLLRELDLEMLLKI